MSVSRNHPDFSMLGSLGAATTCGGMAGAQRPAPRRAPGGRSREDLALAGLAGSAASVPGGAARSPSLAGCGDETGWLGDSPITFVALADIARVSLS